MAPSAVQFVFEAIGTKWVIDVGAPLDQAAEEALLKTIEARIDSFDRAYSRFRTDSLVAQMAERAGAYELPDDAEPMLRLYERLYRLTNGLVTPLIGQVLVDAGYDATYSLVPKTMSVPPSWEEVLSFEAPRTLTVHRPARLDFGALGKGYLIDLISELLTDQGFMSFCVEAGGDMRIKSTEGESIRVGLEHPGDATKAIGVATIRNQSICGSSGNRRRWDRFHHIINPKTLSSPREIMGLWTVADTTLVADAMATALFFAEPEALLKEYPFEYLMMYADGSVKFSKGFPGEVFG